MPLLFARPKTLDSYGLILKGATASVLRDKPVAAIVRRDIIDIVRDLEADGRHGMASLARARLSGFFAWLVHDEKVATNPAASIKLNAPEKGERAPLTVAAVRRIYAVAAEIEGAGGALTRFLVLSAKRRREVSLTRWCDLGHLNGNGELILDGDLNAEFPVWQIPAANSKNGRGYVVPLPPALVGIIRDRPRLGPYVFATSGSLPFAGFSGLKAKLGEAIAMDGGPPMPPWSFHSFRAAFSTYANNNGIARSDVIELALSHEGFRNGVRGIYDRSDYLDDHRRLLMAWANVVTAGTETNANVILLDRSYPD
jgi:integrase